MKTETICPLGCECEQAVDGTLVTCAWYTEIVGQDPQTGESVNEKKCAMAWMPMLMIEQARQQRSTAAAIEGHNSVMKGATDAMVQVEREKALGE